MNSNGNPEVVTSNPAGAGQGKVISASLGAILSSLATLSCCVPMGFAAALGTAGLSAFAQKFRPWLLGLSVVLIGLGFWQQRRARQCAVKRSYLSEVLLWSAVAVVVMMIVFPQEIAGFLANHWPGAPR